MMFNIIIYHCCGIECQKNGQKTSFQKYTKIGSVWIDCYLKKVGADSQFF